jgi:preprotein translocase subunit SecE
MKKCIAVFLVTIVMSVVKNIIIFMHFAHTFLYGVDYIFTSKRGFGTSDAVPIDTVQISRLTFNA